MTFFKIHYYQIFSLNVDKNFRKDNFLNQALYWIKYCKYCFCSLFQIDRSKIGFQIGIWEEKEEKDVEETRGHSLPPANDIYKKEEEGEVDSMLSKQSD